MSFISPPTPSPLVPGRKRLVDSKRIRLIVQQGDLYRLASPYKHDYAVLTYVNEDRSRAVVFVLGLDRTNPVLATVPLAGLDEADRYDIHEINSGSSRHSVKIDAGVLTVGLDGPFDPAVLEFMRH